MAEKTAIDGPPGTPDPSAPAAPSPARRRWRWLVPAVVALVLGGAAIWYDAAVIRAHPVRYDGGESGVLGSGVVNHDDPFATEWSEVPYRAGGTVHVEFNIHNTGPFDAHVQRITFLGLGSDLSTSPPYGERPLHAVGIFPGPRDLPPFQPFTLPADGWAIIGWDLSMCPDAPGQSGAWVGFEQYEITYTYLGWTRTSTEPLPAPVQLTDVGECLANSTPG